MDFRSAGIASFTEKTNYFLKERNLISFYLHRILHRYLIFSWACYVNFPKYGSLKYFNLGVVLAWFSVLNSLFI